MTETDVDESELIARSQAWFWTEEWQAGEKEDDADIAAGRLERFDASQSLLDSLDTE